MMRYKMRQIYTNLTGGIEEIDTWTKNGQIKIKKPSAILEYNKMKCEVDKQNQLRFNISLAIS